MPTMTDEDKKILIELLGECNHKISRKKDGQGFYFSHCSLCGQSRDRIFIRAFTTWRDTGDLKDKIVEAGKWSDFVYFAWKQWPDRSTANWTDLSNWLMDKDRFPQLVVKWLKERNKT